MSNADRTTLQIAKEGATTFGTNPDANFDLIRFTSESLTRETANTTSAVIRSDRNVEDVVRTSISASCELAQELELPAIDRVERAMIAAAVGHAADNGTASGGDNVVGTGCAGTLFDSTHGAGTPLTGFTSTGNFQVADNWADTQWCRLVPVTNVSNAALTTNFNGGGYFRVITRADNYIEVEGSQIVSDTTFTAGDTLQGESHYMDNGVAEPSFTIEKQHLDLTTDCMEGVGMTVDSWTLSVSPENIITSTFGMQGQNASQLAAISTSSVGAAPTGEILNAIDHVAGIYATVGPDSGSGAGLANYPDNRLRPLDGVTSFDLTISNGLRSRAQVGFLGPKSFGQSAISVSGSLTVYYDSASSDMIEKLYEGFEDGALAIALEALDVQSTPGVVTTPGLVIDMPRVKFTGATRHATGTGTDVMAELSFTAFYDATAAETVSLHWFSDV